MLETLSWLIVGILIGWHCPQPMWTKKLMDKTNDIIDETVKDPWNFK